MYLLRAIVTKDAVDPVVVTEILNASQKIRDPMSVEYSIAREPLAGLKSRAD